MLRATRILRRGVNTMARRQPQKPVIAVIGATGTGKSQLAVELACRFNGEIINSDAMQLYEGLPVITNKITPEEMKGVPHHLLGAIPLSEDTWTVTEFVKRALSLVDDIHSRGKLPILVGGTHYYIQSLLFKDSLADGGAQHQQQQQQQQQQSEESKPEENAEEDSSEKYPILDEPTDVILAKLRDVDPVMADRWHPNDRRKIQRSLELWLKTGKPASQIYEEQSLRKQQQQQQQQQQPAAAAAAADCEEKETAAPPGTQQRFPALLFWVHAANDVLRARLDGRVEKMLAAGLLAEVASLSRFLQQQQEGEEHVDRTRGIWVSIGYKEFEAYQRALQSGSAADDGALAKLKAQAVEQVQAGTRQYAKRQLRWIRIKLLNALANARATDSLYLLDGSDLARWRETVEAPALEMAAKFLEGEEPLPAPRSLSDAAAEMLTPRREYDLSERRDMWQRRTCETCGIVSVTEGDWNKHVQSKGHKVREKKRRQKQAAAAGAGHPQKQAKELEAELETPVVGDVESTMAAFDDLVNSQK